MDKLNIKIEYLNLSDEYLIADIMVDIIKNVNQYIENMNSEKLKNYNKFYNIIYTKYLGKKYLIETPLNQIIVYTLDKKTIIHIYKPEYIQISSKLQQYKEQISNMRIELNKHYSNIIYSTSGITPSEKDDFIKQKTDFIQILKKYYTIIIFIKLYHQHKNNTNNVIVNINELYIIRDISGYIIYKPRINSKVISVSQELVSQKQLYESDKLNQYNEILTILQNQPINNLTTENKTKIISYLDNNENFNENYNEKFNENFNENFNNINDINNDMIDIIIIKLPEIISN